MEVPSCQVSIRRPSAAGDHSPALSVQITHEETRKIDNRAPPSRVLGGCLSEAKAGGFIHRFSGQMKQNHPAPLVRGAAERSEAEGSYPRCPSEMTPIPINTPAPSGRPPSRDSRNHSRHSRYPRLKSIFPVSDIKLFPLRTPLPTIKNL